MRGFIAILLVMFLGGCAALNPDPQYFKSQADVKIATIKAQSKANDQAEWEWDCSAKCSGKYYGRNKIGVSKIDAGVTAADVVIAGIKGGTKLGKKIADVRAMDKIFSAVGDRNVTINGDDNNLDMDNTDITTTNSKSSAKSGDVVGDTTGDTTGDTSGDVVTSGDVRGDETISGDVTGDTHGAISGDTSGDVRGDEVNDSYHPITTTSTTTTSTDTSEENITNEKDPI